MSDVTQRIERILSDNTPTPSSEPWQGTSVLDIMWLCRLALAQEKVIAFRKSGTIHTREELDAWHELEAARRDPA